ncbi:MAG TPA: GGDEF domain-containing protein [Spongiibacteraceae bacterium]|nr:GGDEF domain-containing protein [Spongiibacteraceae bacterium]
MRSVLRRYMGRRLPNDTDLRFRANLLLSILSTIDILSSFVILYFIFAAPLQMDTDTRRWALQLIVASAAIYCSLTVALLNGYYRIAMIGTVTVALTSVGGAVMATSGLPASPAVPLLLLPAIIAFCILGPYRGILVALLIPALCALQWYLSTYWGLQLPASQSGKNPVMDGLLINGVNYCLVIAVLLVYERINNNLRRERDAERQRLAHFATHDDLTGLANRRHFLQRLAESCARCDRGGQQVGVLYIDLNGFKKINDSLGHSAGDKTLVQIAERLTAMLRRQDLVARLGGDEFAIVIDPCGPQSEINDLCQRIQNRIAEPLIFDASQLSIGASIGVALYPSEGIDIDHVLRLADVAMYAAKHARDKTAA